MVENIKKILMDSIIKYGIADNKTYETSKQLDEAIKGYYKMNYIIYLQKE